MFATCPIRCSRAAFIAASSGSKWPFVTLKNYEHYAGLAREASGLEMINIALNVQEDDRLAFLNYTDANYQAWIEESHKINPEYAGVSDDTKWNNTGFGASLGYRFGN